MSGERMLRHVPTGDLYIFTSILAARGDMELVEDDEVPITVEGEFAQVEDDESALEVKVRNKPGRKAKAVQENEVEVQSEAFDLEKSLDELMEE